MRKKGKPPAAPGRASLDSQEALRRSIARSVRDDPPANVTDEDLERSVENSLTTEAARNERTIAGVRATFLIILTVLNSVGLLLGELGSPLLLSSESTVFLAVAAAAALLFYWKLRAGWYRPALRRIVPLGDAAIIVGAFAVYVWAGPGIAVGMVASSATACVFLAFSGALRLSRSAARLATVLAVSAWLIIAVLSHWPTVSANPDARTLLPIAYEVVFVAAALFATGYLGTHVTRTIRRVVTNEVGRARYATLYAHAQAAVLAREEVLQIVSHDLRNPLNVIAMTAELLMSDEAADLPPLGRNEHLHRICRAGERMNRMIQDLLDVARMEAGKLEVVPAPVACADLLGEVSDMMTPLAADRQLELRVLCPADPPTIMVDRGRIMQVFSNLIGNAIKFTPPGGLICVQAQRMSDKVRFSVSDTGPGIPAEQREKIFQRLWQADRSDGRGLGLGLAIARSIVEAHHGRIGIESSDLPGTTFWFTTKTA